MKTRPLGASGINASVVAFGAWAIGGWKWGGSDADASVAAIGAALDSGVNFIDTAAIYGFGLSEELVGKAIRGRNRGDLVIATKCGLRWDLDAADGHMLHGSASPDQPIHRSNRPASIRHECEQSLKRLGTDYIDLYYTHWQDPNVPIAETMGALMDLKREGKIRAIGTCNATPEDLAAYAAAGQLDADQELWNALERGKSANARWTSDQGAAFCAYSPMAQGLLTGAIGPDRVFAGDDIRKGNPKYSLENRQRVARLLERVAPIATAHGVQVEHVMLAWTLQQSISHMLVGARDAGQARNNARAGQVVLSGADLQDITDAVEDFGNLLGDA